MSTPPITSKALWNWDVTGTFPVVKTYASGQPTKTGLTPADLQNFCYIPTQTFNTPIRQVDSNQLLQWIRWAEDSIEQSAGILLSQSWVASPPEFIPANCVALGINPTYPGGYQQQGYDYDIEDAAYDFIYNRAQDEGWMVCLMRYRPVRSLIYGPDITKGEQSPFKNISYVYPLLNQYFNVPWQWEVVDSDYGVLRLVPSTNVAMLPLFAMQLAFLGFAQSVPGGIHFQYTAGLTPMDYQTRFSFVKQLVLAEASIITLTNLQGTVNMGALEYMIHQDGFTYRTSYDKNGPFAGIITQYEKQRDMLMGQLRGLVAGPMLSAV